MYDIASYNISSYKLTKNEDVFIHEQEDAGEFLGFLKTFQLKS